MYQAINLTVAAVVMFFLQGLIGPSGPPGSDGAPGRIGKPGRDVSTPLEQHHLFPEEGKEEGEILYY